MNERKARQIVKERSEGRCEVCWTAPGTDMHHRKNRSQGGTWTPENLMHLCHVHHMHITVNPRTSREQGWTVPSYADPARTPVWIAGRGWSHLRSDGSVAPTEGKAA